MKFYFSGVRSPREAALLTQAGITHVLVDPASYTRIAPSPFPNLVLDSGAYAAYKAGQMLTTASYAATLSELPLEVFTWITCNDVIGDPAQTKANWCELNALGYTTIPVWQWGSSLTDLYAYLHRAPLVGIGGLVPHLRDRRNEKLDKAAKAAWDRQRTKTLAALLGIVQQHPQRFHLFGLCWVKAFNALAPYLASADSSLWLNGRKYGLALFIHSKTGKLTLAPKAMLPTCIGMTPDELCSYNAAQINHFSTT